MPWAWIKLAWFQTGLFFGTVHHELGLSGVGWSLQMVTADSRHPVGAKGLLVSGARWWLLQSCLGLLQVSLLQAWLLLQHFHTACTIKLQKLLNVSPLGCTFIPGGIRNEMKCVVQFWPKRGHASLAGFDAASGSTRVL